MIIIVRIHRGLGNQLFQYAYAKDLALKYNRKLYLDLSFYKSNHKLRGNSREFRLDNFNIDYKVANDKIVNFYRKNILGLALNKINSKLLKRNLVFFKNLYVIGDGQRYNSFKGNLEVIRKELSLKEEIQNCIATNKIYKSVNSEENSVSIHIRRGDYVGWEFFDLCNNDYFNKAINSMNSRLQKPHYYIFSEDLNWCRKNLFFKNENVTYVENINDDIKEFAIMSCCKHNIISNSTYSWWAAMLNKNPGKIVIAPYIWFKRNNGYVYSQSRIPDAWEIIKF